jgi:kynurenine formamidase
LARTGKVFALGMPIDGDGPQGAHGMRRNPIHLMTMDGGDGNLVYKKKDTASDDESAMSKYFENAPARFTDDYIIMPLQSGTQWDALSHCYYEGKIYNGYPASSVSSFGAVKNAINVVAERGQIVGRGVLLDVARHRGVTQLQADQSIPPEELDAVVAAQGVEIRDGDIVVVRTGWTLEWLTHRDGDAWTFRSPGLSWRCAEWLYDHNIAAVAADNVAVEVMKPDGPTTSLFHMLALRDMGMMMGEIWNLEALGADCAADKIYEFLLIAQALPVTGAVGTPVNPIAIK